MSKDKKGRTRRSLSKGEKAKRSAEIGSSEPRLVNIKVNGVIRAANVEPRMLLVDFIRTKLSLTGTHIGCDTSNCGACTILLNGSAIKSCTMFAVQADGSDITTIEGLGSPGRLHPLQEEFWQNHALQCGFCTPGMIMTSVGLLNENPNPSEEEIRLDISGTLCRCTGYQNIVRAVQATAKRVGIAHS